MALLLFPLSFTRRRRKVAARYRFGGGLVLFLFAMAAMAGLFGVTGCGGSGSTTTQAGTYAVPVTITAGTSRSTLNVMIVVQ